MGRLRRCKDPGGAGDEVVRAPVDAVWEGGVRLCLHCARTRAVVAGDRAFIGSRGCLLVASSFTTVNSRERGLYRTQYLLWTGNPIMLYVCVQF